MPESNCATSGANCASHAHTNASTINVQLAQALRKSLSTSFA